MKTRILVAICIALASQACIIVTDGDDERVTRNVEVEAFDSIEIERNVDYVDIEICPENCRPSIEVTGGASSVDELRIDSVGGILAIDGEHDGLHLHGGPDLTVKIKTPKLVQLVLTASGNTRATGFAGGDLELIVTGSGDTELAGFLRQLDATITGSGDLEAFELETQVVDANISGSGDAEVCATRELRAVLTGSGDLTYACNPQQRDVESTGSGDVGAR